MSTQRKRWPGLRRLWRDERGQVGNVEVLPFGVLIFVVGALLVSNAWAVIDARMAVAHKEGVSPSGSSHRSTAHRGQRNNL